MNRTDKIVHLCNLKGKGLEIGPSYNPILPKRDGYDIETIDHMDKKGLIEKYTGHGVNIDSIEEVDYVWKGEKYTELTGKTNHYDYIIASNVIEHTCDLLGFLNDCYNLLNENGVLSLVIPDKRFCFDFFRPVTGISRVIDSYLEKRSLHSPGAICEHFLYASSNNGNIAWLEKDPSNLRFVHTLEETNRMYDISLTCKEYLDVHNWVFTKSSFELLVYDLNALNLTHFYVAESFETDGFEFFVSLKKNETYSIPNENERLQLVWNMHNELLEDTKTFDMFVNSRSWRVTAPLRTISLIFRRLLKK